VLLTGGGDALNVSAKVWAVIAAVIAVLAILVTHLSSPGSTYKLSVTEYDCNADLTTNPEAFQQQVLATVTFSCKTPPKTTDLILTLQVQDKAGTWQNVGSPRQFTGTPPTSKVSMNVSAPCAAGNWRAGYDLSGTGAATGNKFDLSEKWGSSVTMTDAQCVNS
jgi:hypothetical protein